MVTERHKPAGCTFVGNTKSARQPRHAHNPARCRRTAVGLGSTCPETRRIAGISLNRGGRLRFRRSRVCCDSPASLRRNSCYRRSRLLERSWVWSGMAVFTASRSGCLPSGAWRRPVHRASLFGGDHVRAVRHARRLRSGGRGPCRLLSAICPGRPSEVRSITFRLLRHSEFL